MIDAEVIDEKTIAIIFSSGYKLICENYQLVNDKSVGGKGKFLIPTKPELGKVKKFTPRKRKTLFDD